MRSRLIFSVLVLVSMAAVGARGEIIVAGHESPTDAGSGPDSWFHILYVDETNPFDFSPAGQTAGYVTSFTFYAKDQATRDQMITPFVVEPLAPNDFIVRHIGTTREEGTDWTGTGLQAVVFDGSHTPLVQQGWMAGFLTSSPDGQGSGSPVPYDNTGREGWLTGSSTESATTPRLQVGLAPTLGASGTFSDGLGRSYQFNIGAIPTPEPTAGLLLVLGLAAVVSGRRR